MHRFAPSRPRTALESCEALEDTPCLSMQQRRLFIEAEARQAVKVVVAAQWTRTADRIGLPEPFLDHFGKWRIGVRRRAQADALFAGLARRQPHTGRAFLGG